MKNLTAIILAGGKSTRMGENKGLMFFQNKPMISYVIDTLNRITSNIIIVANDTSYKQFGFQVYEDLIPEKGPLGGIYSGLHYSKTERNIIVSCDTPFVSVEILKWLLWQNETSQVTFPMFDDKLHPLIGIYNKSCLDTLKRNISKNQLKLLKTNKDLNCNIVDANQFNKANFYNFNTKLDIKKYADESKC